MRSPTMARAIVLCRALVHGGDALSQDVILIADVVLRSARQGVGEGQARDFGERRAAQGWCGCRRRVVDERLRLLLPECTHRHVVVEGLYQPHDLVDIAVPRGVAAAGS